MSIGMERDRRLRRLSAIAAALLSLAPGPAGAEAPSKLEASSGVYVDGTGRRQSWHIGEDRGVQWDGKPFMPVGGMFCFRYLSEHTASDSEGNERRWAEDVAILRRLRQAGIVDTYVNPVNPATRYPAAAWSRCLRQLDLMGFRYGIELTDGPRQGMDGYLLGGHGWRVRQDGKRLKLSFSPEFGEQPRLTELLAVTAAGRAGRVEVLPSSGREMTLEAPAWTRESGTVFIPRIVAPRGFNVPDLWGGYEEYEARLLRLLGQLHRGPGLRFVVDPFTNEMNYYGYTAHMVPAETFFRRPFEIWLQARYGSLDRLREAWGLPAGGEFPSTWRAASRTIPVPSPASRRALDPLTLKTWPVDSDRSLLVEDLRHFRDASVQEYCNRISRAVRSGFADVPVVFKHTREFMRFLVKAGEEPGFNGVGMEVWGKTAEELARSGGPVLAVLEQWKHPGWNLVTETAPSATPRGGPIGYPSRLMMVLHLDTLVRLGARGLYLFALRPLPEELLSDYLLYKEPQQIAWLADYQIDLARGRLERLARAKPAMSFVPAQRGAGLNVRGWPEEFLNPIEPVTLRNDELTLPRWEPAGR